MMMTQAKQGDTVTVHYTGKLDDGTVFDSSANRDPLQFSIGEGNVIPGFEQAVMGMSPGESKTAIIPADQAYGPHYQEMVLVVDRNQIPDNLPVEIGQQLQIRQQGGQTIPVMITEVSEAQVTLDANHPLAGEDLTFDIQLVEIG
uniref:FKBP-type peptidyl-prolyl cis-trans isomerase n=2 Tax=Oculatella sp. LEGE 06141 TaxID=1828648 RepID=UPI00272DDA53|nr:peptidylprolyl isomerase [Oculatella sp. LEGE 06141]